MKVIPLTLMLVFSLNGPEVNGQEPPKDWKIFRIKDGKRVEVSFPYVRPEVQRPLLPGVSAELVQEMAQRLFQMMQKHAEIHVKENYPDLKDNPGRRKMLEEFFINKILSQKIGSPGKGGKSVTNTGYVGSNPLSIRRIIKEGNFRERMYLIFKGGKYLGETLSDQKLVGQINKKLTADPTLHWTLNQSIMNQEPGADPYELGVYTQYRARKSLSAEDTRDWPKRNNPPLRELRPRIPLSEREKRLLTLLTPDDRDPVPWLPGAAWLQAETPSTYRPKAGEADALPYLKATEETFSPQISSVSSTTDRILTTARYLGFPEEDLMKARLAAMVDARDHSIHEIMTASKSFHLPYEMGPFFYRDIYPEDPEFISKLEKAQERRGYKLPPAYLQEDCILEKLAQHPSLNGPVDSKDQTKDQLVCEFRY